MDRARRRGGLDQEAMMAARFRRVRGIAGHQADDAGGERTHDNGDRKGAKPVRCPPGADQRGHAGQREDVERGGKDDPEHRAGR
jgi:hypothetical protein